jgi:hypothetical protein
MGLADFDSQSIGSRSERPSQSDSRFSGPIDVVQPPSSTPSYHRKSGSRRARPDDAISRYEIHRGGRTFDLRELAGEGAVTRNDTTRNLGILRV